MPTQSVPTSQFSYDLFISYSRHNKDFAVKLRDTLEKYAPPKGLNLPSRRLSVFLDQNDLSGTAYFEAIAAALGDSQKLLVLCSPAARKSEYVNDELRRFAKLRGAENIIPLLIEGIPNNEVRPEQENESAFPAALCEVKEMPLATDFRNFDVRRDKLNKSGFSSAWHTTLANFFDVPVRELEQREQKRQSRKRQLIGSMATAVILLT